MDQVNGDGLAALADIRDAVFEVRDRLRQQDSLGDDRHIKLLRSELFAMAGSIEKARREDEHLRRVPPPRHGCGSANVRLFRPMDRMSTRHSPMTHIEFFKIYVDHTDADAVARAKNYIRTICDQDLSAILSESSEIVARGEIHAAASVGRMLAGRRLIREELRRRRTFSEKEHGVRTL